MTNIGERIEKLRKKADLNQEQLSNMIGLKRVTLSKIENNERKLTAEELIKFSNIFNMTLDQFVNPSHEPEVVIIESNDDEKKTQSPIRINIPKNNVKKFKQVLLYIFNKVGSKPNIGQTVIYKLLYFIDFDYYEKYEEQLMGLVYLKSTHGPTPYYFDELIKEMKDKGIIEELKSKFYTYPQTKYLINPRIEPDLSILNGLEIEHIEWEIGRLSDLTASMLSELSHKDVPWISAEDGKPLDYESVFYRTKDTSIREYEADED